MAPWKSWFVASTVRSNVLCLHLGNFFFLRAKLFKPIQKHWKSLWLKILMLSWCSDNYNVSWSKGKWFTVGGILTISTQTSMSLSFPFPSILTRCWSSLMRRRKPPHRRFYLRQETVMGCVYMILSAHEHAWENWWSCLDICWNPPSLTPLKNA